ncbi:MAG: SDR family oxidoreductase [Actinomycetota bacterium]|nr:SDR family oxidoreductase [Actinomycetota bacterium]
MTAELFDLTGEVAVVTGGGRGIGEGIARTFAGAGAAVVVAARRQAEIERVAKEIEAEGGVALAVVCDVTDADALDALAAATIARFGRVSIWVNNAGGSPVRAPLCELDRATWDQTIALNLTAVWSGCVTAARVIEEGCIINVSSLAGFGPVPGSGHYAAAKAGVHSLTQTLARELAPRIRVNCIAPGSVPTEIMMQALDLSDADLERYRQRSRIPLERLGTPQDIGATALYLAAPAAAWITGQILTVSGGQ